VPVVHFSRSTIGSAAPRTSRHNIVALGGRPSLVGLVGGDAAAETLREQVKAAGIRVNGLVEDRSRPTTEKVRVVTERNQQVARIDRETDSDARGDVARRCSAREVAGARHEGAAGLRLPQGNRVRDAHESAGRDQPWPGAARRRAPRSADRRPKVPHLDCYAGATLVTPNHHEAEAPRTG
jgi:D-beta-D-heptose 7-phosphate kinase/D-beta-D-heptose 1-phosphate adenosyltransferase